MKVAVIGAGPSGLVTIKELLEEQHEVACFERAPDIGGIFRFDPNGHGVWESCRLTSSAIATTYSDFPPDPDASLHQTHEEYLQYLRAYCAHFSLRDYIRFGHEVKALKREPDGTWRVEVRDGTTTSAHSFDAVAVCSGLHHAPSEPKIPGRASFGGEIAHACTYKNPAPFKDRRVVVVGGGESGADIAAELAPVAGECLLSIRQAPFVTPRLIRGLPNDYYTTRLRYSLPAWVERAENPPGTRRLRSILGLLTLPISLPVWLFDTLERFVGDRVKRLRARYDVPVDVSGLIESLRRASGGGLDEQFVTKSERFIYAVLDGSCTLKPAPVEFTQTGMTFQDGTTADADAVIFCTGYHSKFPFLDMDVSDSRRLFKNCFHIETGSTFAMIGLVRPAVGSIPVIAEMQARWFARLCSGHCQLPDERSMREQSDRDAAFHRQHFRRQTDRLPYLVDFTSYLDDLADRIGCKPLARELLRDPSLLKAVYTKPFSAHQYRLKGPHAKPDIVRPVLDRLPRSQPLRTIALQILSYAVCRSLAAIGFERFRLHLRSGLAETGD